MSVTRRRFLASTGLSAAGALVAHTACQSAPATPEPPGGPQDWAAVREQFDLAPDYIHLGLFFITSHPRPVREAIERHRRSIDSNPLLYVEEHMFEGEGRVQRAAADYLGGKAEEVALTDSTTMGLALVYHGLPLRAGDEVLTTEHDHYSHHESIRLAAERAGATVRKIRLFDDFGSISEDEIVDRVRKSVGPRTRAVGITWVHSSSGLKLPVRRIAGEIAAVNAGRGPADRVLLIVDGVHGLGVEDETVAKLGCDFFVAGTHKWVFGPRGTGVVWARADNWKEMSPTIPAFAEGPYGAWMRGDVPRGTQASWVTPGGFHSFEHRWALPAAFDFHRRIGRAKVAARIHALNEQCKEGLARMRGVKLYTPRGGNLSAGLICFDLEGMRPNAVVARLLKKRILATTTPYGVSYARLAPGLLNTPDEIETTLREIRALV